MHRRWRNLFQQLQTRKFVCQQRNLSYSTNVDSVPRKPIADHSGSLVESASPTFAVFETKLREAYDVKSHADTKIAQKSTANVESGPESSSFPSFSSVYQLLKSNEDIYYTSSPETPSDTLPGRTYAPHVTSLERLFGISEPSASTSAVPVSRRWLARRALLSLLHPLFLPFLPAHFPNHFGDNAKPYLAYAYNSFIASIFGAAASIVSMQALLVAMGMTAIHAAPAAAALTWIIKDLIGQVGGALLASQTAHHFDAQPRLHRLKATRLFLYAAALELLTPLFPALFVPIGAVANMMKNVSWLVTGATRASAHLTFASVANLGDVTGKSGAQATAAGVIGTSLGAWVSYLLAAADRSKKDEEEAKEAEKEKENNANATTGDATSASETPAHSATSTAPGARMVDVMLSWSAFAALGVASYIFTRRAVAAVTSRTLDRYRADIVLTHCAANVASALKPNLKNKLATMAGNAQNKAQVLALCSPFAVARVESMEKPYLPHGWGHVSLSFNDACVDESDKSRDVWSIMKKASATIQNKLLSKPNESQADTAESVPVWAEALGSDAISAWWTLQHFENERYVLCIGASDNTALNTDRVPSFPHNSQSNQVFLDRLAEAVWSHLGWGNAKSCTISQTAARPVTRRSLSWSERICDVIAQPLHFLQRNKLTTPPRESAGAVPGVSGPERVRVWLKERSSHRDQLRAYTHAWVARHLLMARRNPHRNSTHAAFPDSESVLRGDGVVKGDVSLIGEATVRELYAGLCSREITTLSDRDVVVISHELCEKYLWDMLETQVDGHDWNLTTLYLADIDGYVEFPVVHDTQTAGENKTE